jgi:hypothetical protein
VREGFFAYWINARGHRFPIIKRIKCSTFIFSDEAEAAGAVADEASPSAQAALHFLVWLFFVEHGFMQ